jgi:hypothetical protein
MRHVLTAFALVLAAGAAPRPATPAFQKITLDLGASETAAIADINKDGRLDIVSGEAWYQAPDWRRRVFRELGFESQYIDNFSDLPIDIDGDGYTDIASCSWFARKLAWWKNPGPKGAGPWKETVIESGAPIEFCFLVDLDNDGQAREILPQFGNVKAPLKWYEVRNGAVAGHAASPQSYGHGIGAGDVNGDGRTDILTPKGWLEAPADPRTGAWTLHKTWDLGSTGFLHVLDVNGDGRPDVLTSLAHDFGIFWLEGPADPRTGEWKRQMIDESWSQAHALTRVDLHGGKRTGLLTGKRYMAHNGKDPGERDPLGVYWYELLPGARPQWVRHILDYSTRTGGGMQLPVADLNGDGRPDFVAPGKSGLFLFLSQSPAVGASKQ